MTMCKHSLWTVRGITILAVMFAPEIHAATFNCTAGDVGCLIDAITTANSNAADDEIVLEPGVYTLIAIADGNTCPGAGGYQGLPVIEEEAALVIRSEDAEIRRGANAPPFRIMCIQKGNVTLEGITIRGGRVAGAGEFGADTYGGGVFAKARLNLIRSSLSENVADWGGGIFWIGSELNVVEATIKNNQGGGIINESGPGIMRVIDSAIYGNRRVVGEDDYGDSAGIVTETELIVINSTVSDNEGPGVALYGGNDWSITNGTITRNGYGEYVGGQVAGGIFNWARFENVRVLKNTIVAENFGTDHPDCEWNVQLESAGNNIIGDATGCDIVLQPSDLVGEPGLDSFAENGKPGYGHYPPLKGSPVIDAGDDTACSPLDQIGNPRYDGDADGTILCDIGAIEYQGEHYEIAIDFKPGNRRNLINPYSKGRLWIAIVSDETFDALQVDSATVALGPGEASPDRYRVKDVNRDRLPDLMLCFKTPEVGLQCGDTDVELSGETYAGDSIIGTDKVKTVGCKKKPKKGKKK